MSAFKRCRTAEFHCSSWDNHFGCHFCFALVPIKWFSNLTDQCFGHCAVALISAYRQYNCTRTLIQQRKVVGRWQKWEQKKRGEKVTGVAHLIKEGKGIWHCKIKRLLRTTTKIKMGGIKGEGSYDGSVWSIDCRLEVTFLLEECYYLVFGKANSLGSTDEGHCMVAEKFENYLDTYNKRRDHLSH